MYSSKTSQEWCSTQVSQKHKSNFNDLEASKQSVDIYSDDYSLNLYKLNTFSKNAAKDIRDSIFDIKYKKKSLNKSKNNSHSKEILEEILSNEIYDDTDKDTLKCKKNTKRKKSKNENKSQSHESESSEKKSNEKKKRKKHREKEKFIELPITEVLKRAQEHRTKYEDPIPLPELATSIIYVQGKDGFNTRKIRNSNKHTRKSPQAIHRSMSKTYPIKIAIVFQKFGRTSGLLFQGLLGGIALLHLIFMKTYFDNYKDLIRNYPIISEIYTSIFSFLIVTCIISIFDIYDLAQMRKNYFHTIIARHLISVLSVPLCITVFLLHQVTSKVDDKLTLLQYSFKNSTYYSNHKLNNISNNIHIEELKTWQSITSLKDALTVLSWIFVSICIHKNMLLENLEDMNKYADNMNS